MPNFYKQLHSSFESLAWSWSGRSLPPGEPVGVLVPWTGAQCAWVPSSSFPNYSPTPVPPWWRKQSGKWGFLVVDTLCHIRHLKDPWESAFSWLVSPTPPRALKDLPPIPFLTIPPSRCGTCPFTWGSGLISKISFCLVHFGPFVNYPPCPEICFIDLLLAGRQLWVQRDLVYLTACPMLKLHQVFLAGEGFLVAGVNGLVV